MQANEQVALGAGQQPLTFADAAVAAVWLDTKPPAMVVTSDHDTLVRARVTAETTGRTAKGIAAPKENGGQVQAAIQFAPGAFANNEQGSMMTVEVEFIEALEAGDLVPIAAQAPESVCDRVLTRLMTFIKTAQEENRNAEAEDAYTALYRGAYPKLLDKLKWRCLAEIAEEVATESLWNAWRKARTWNETKPPRSCMAWLVTIANKELSTTVRKDVLVDVDAVVEYCKDLDDPDWAILSARFFANIEPALTAKIRAGTTEAMSSEDRDIITTNVLRPPTTLEDVERETGEPRDRCRFICSNFIKAVCRRAVHNVANPVEQKPSSAVRDVHCREFANAALAALRCRENPDRAGLAIYHFGVGVLYSLDLTDMPPKNSSYLAIQSLNSLSPKQREELLFYHCRVLMLACGLLQPHRTAWAVFACLIVLILKSCSKLTELKLQWFIILYSFCISRGWDPVASARQPDKKEEKKPPKLVDPVDPQLAVNDMPPEKIAEELCSFIRNPIVRPSEELTRAAVQWVPATNRWNLQEAKERIASLLRSIMDDGTCPQPVTLCKASSCDKADKADATLVDELVTTINHLDDHYEATGPLLANLVLAEFGTALAALEDSVHTAVQREDVEETQAFKAILQDLGSLASPESTKMPSPAVAGFVTDYLQSGSAMSGAAVHALVGIGTGTLSQKSAAYRRDVWITYRGHDEIINAFRDKWLKLDDKAKSVVLTRYPGTLNQSQKSRITTWLNDTACPPLSDDCKAALAETLIPHITKTTKDASAAIDKSWDKMLEEFQKAIWPPFCL